MTKYVALIRGVGPGNPNMHSAPLTDFFKKLGFQDVKTVISSGNVVFFKAMKHKLENLKS